jgi:hypothetical protein
VKGTPEESADFRSAKIPFTYHFSPFTRDQGYSVCLTQRLLAPPASDFHLL